MRCQEMQESLVRILGDIPQFTTDIPMAVSTVVSPRQDLQCCKIHYKISGDERRQ